MTAKLVAQGGDHLCAEALFLPRTKAHHKRESQKGSGNILLDRFKHRPTPFA